MSGEPVIGQPLTLAAARKLASDLHRQRALGKDVISDHMAAKRRRKIDHAERTTNAFAPLARRFIEEYARPKTRSWASSARLLGLAPNSLEPVKGGLAERWATRPVAEITGHDIHDLVGEIRVVGIPGVAARRVGPSDSTARVSLAHLSKFFSWVIERRLLAVNPCSGAWRPDASPPRDRVLDDRELKLFWRAAGDLGEPFSQALKLLLLTGQRRTEVAGMRRSELDGDAWLLPANRSRIRGPTPCRCRKRRRT